MRNEAHFNLTLELSKEYCLLKYKQEQEYKEIKSSFDIELCDLKQDIIEEGISKRNIDNHRSAYEKLINTSDYEFPNADVPTPAKQAEIIYQLLLDTLDNNSSNSKLAFKSRYVDAEQIIIKYFTRYFEIKNELAAFKQKQKLISDELVLRIKEEGIPLFIVKYVYKRMKTDLSIINVSQIEFGYSEDLYNLLKDELLLEAQNV